MIGKKQSVETEDLNKKNLLKQYVCPCKDDYFDFFQLLYRYAKYITFIISQN